MPTLALDPSAAGAALTEALLGVVALSPSAVEPVLCAMFAGGHVLLDGVPGIGKTLFARTLARGVGGDFHRIQFTNDLLPSDVVGTSVWRQDRGEFTFVRGPLFANLVLADEINRTSPRTLSCLLEAMESGKVSVEGRTVELAQPFTVLATRNPIEFHGTYPVPEAALDRFLVRVELGYPEAAAERALYLGDDPEERLAAVAPVLHPEDLLAIRAAAAAVVVAAPVADYVYRVVQGTRQHPEVQLGASPRAAMAWLRAARARALLAGRSFVRPDDLKALALPVLAHRVFRRDGAPADAVLQSVLATTAVPL